MAKFYVGCVVQGKSLGDVMEVLQPFKVDDLQIKLVAGTATKVKDGATPGWQVVAAAATTTPQKATFFKKALADAGFKPNSYNTYVNRAAEERAIHVKMVKGVKMYVRPSR